MEEHLQIPLPLAELLYVTLGPLSEVLKDEDHSWSALVSMVLRTYREGRDAAIEKRYGEHVVNDVDVVTFMVSEELSKWAESLAGEATDFDLWRQELGGDQ